MITIDIEEHFNLINEIANLVESHQYDGKVPNIELLNVLTKHNKEIINKVKYQLPNNNDKINQMPSL